MPRSSLKSVIRLIDVSSSSDLPEGKFLDGLKHTIEVENTSAGKPSRTYKPSSMNCIRNMYYQVVGADIDAGRTSYSSAGICDLGTAIHEIVQRYVTKMADCTFVDVAQFVKERGLSGSLEVRSKKTYETKLYNKLLNLSFMCDGIVKLDNVPYLLEIKSETSSKWYSRTGVDERHYNQAIAYSVSFGIDDVLFLYVNRDLFDLKCYLFHVTDEMKNDLVGRIASCGDFVNRLTVPPKPENVSVKTCNWCPYKTQCRKDG